MKIVRRKDRPGGRWCPVCDVTEVQFRNGDRHYGKGLLVVVRAVRDRTRRLGVREALHQTRHYENESPAAPPRRLTHWRIIDRTRGKTLPRRFDSQEDAEALITTAGRQGEWEAVEHSVTGKLVAGVASDGTPRTDGDESTPTPSADARDVGGF